MTKTDAHRILGITASASPKSAEKAYRQKQQALHIRILPGNHSSVRQQALSDLTELTAAWKIVQTKQPKTNRPKKQRTTTTRQNTTKATTIWDVIQDLSQYWDSLVEMVPFPKFVTKLFLIVWFLLVITILFMRSAKGV